MMKVPSIISIAICASLAACADPTFPPPQSNPVIEPDRGFSLLGADIVSPYYGGLDKPTYLVLRSSDEWAALWRELEPRTSREAGQTNPNPVPVIDFNESSLIVAAIGVKSSGCCSVAIESLNESSDRLLVTVMEKESGSNCVRFLAETHPIALAIIPRTAKAVEFNIIRKVENCD